MADIISAFKGLRARFRKKSKDKSQNTTPASSPISTTNSEAKNEKNVETPQHQEPLKLPPMRQLRESSSYSCHKPTLSVDAGLKTNTSLRLPRSMSMAKNRGSKREDKMQKKREKSKTEDLIWQKTIILGEKCRVPEEDHDDVIYDDKGHKISTFHPKTPRSLPPSRTGSFIDPKAIPR